MNRSRLALALSLALAAGTVLSPAPVQAAGAEVAADGRATWLVWLDAPAVASFEGFGPDAGPKRAALSPTSPKATGARKLDPEGPASLAYREFLGAEREGVLAAAETAIGRKLVPDHVYELVGNGMALRLSREEARRLQTLPGVRRVESEFRRRVMTDAGPAWIGAERAWADEAAGRGEGVVVGVIDTGINHGHPSFAAVGPVDGHLHANPRPAFLGLCATTPGRCNAKLIGIHDFSDELPQDGRDVDGHGSHVAATAAGNVVNASIDVGGSAQPRTLSGVAPHASLVSYKACRADDPATEDEDESGCNGSWLVAAIEQAVADQVDVINYSIGGSSNDPWSDGDASAMLDARNAGVVVVVAAGNDGPSPGSVTSPGDAPWVLSLANATHDRAIAARLVDLEGGAAPPPSDGVLPGASLTSGYGPAPIIVPEDAPGCSIGDDLDSPPSGVSNPWPGQPNRFNGEIVVCERGVQARVAKSFNVDQAGGGGMVLVNTALEGESIVADPHSIPSTHLGFIDGSALLAWLASGSGHSGRIEAASVQSIPSFADRLSSSSGRGPMHGRDYLVPDVTAPGTGILAAAGSGNGFAFLSGTSMASPHAAGAAALLIGARPDWNVDAVMSALVGSARDSARMQDGSTPAGRFDQGAGVVQVDRAVRAGLSFPLAPNAWRNANPAIGGDPRAVNEPALVDGECFEQCSFQRRVRDLAGGGDWRVVAELPAGIALSASPSTFSLADGAERAIDLDFTITDPSLTGTWIEGAVRIERVTDDLVSDAVMPVAVFASPGDLPERFDVSATGESGHADVAMEGIVALPDARFAATVLTTPERLERTLPQDGTRGDPYDSALGIWRRLATVPAGSGRWQFVAEARSATSTDIDLFMGVDDNGDGSIDAEEERCRSTSPIADERCAIEVEGAASAQTVWLVVQNWQAGGTGSDSVQLEQMLLSLEPSADSALRVTGPGRSASGERLPLRLGWDIPDLLPGASRVGYLLVGADAPSLGRVGQVLVEVSRSGTDAESSPSALVPGATRQLRLAPGARQDRLHVDVPANATSMRVRALGASVDLFASHAASSGEDPRIAPAPPNDEADASVTGASGSVELNVGSGTLVPGRWYLTPHNPGASPVDVGIEVDFEHAQAAPTPRFGAWFNPARSGAGVFLYPAAGSWALIWYTYLQDGTPTWYLGAAPAPTDGAGSWSVDLLRYAWNGSAAHGTPVGEAVLSLHGEDEFAFSWNLDGQSGSERYFWIDDGECSAAAGTDLTGSWFDPSQPGFGFSINAGTALETNAAYFYDDQGRARWAFGGVSPFGATEIPMSQYQGPCPLCDYAAPTTVEVGRFVRDYVDSANGSASLEIDLAAPLSGSWRSDGPLLRATDALGCN